jgi:acyl-CoA synthetase (AMP-forming)/AMP-acid ligase II
MMHQNHPSLFVAQFGLMKIGAIPALINNQLTDAALIHCVKVAKSSFFLVDPVYAGAVQPCVKELSDLGIEIWGFGEHEPSMPFAETLTRDTLSRFSDAEISEEYIENAQYGEPAMLIYTSGTTGLPKPAIVEHTRMNFAGISYMNIHGVYGTDRVYCCLPLYHSSGQIVATAVAIQSGATLVLGRKFSVTKFWEECIRYDVTVMVYIGEICRYLLSQPFNAAENKHRVRMAYGNGMRPDVWNRFRDRFGVGKISEFYGATEGPSSLFNPNTNEFGSGAVGFRGFLTRTLTGELKIIKIDPISEEPVRDKHGYCIEVS